MGKGFVFIGLLLCVSVFAQEPKLKKIFNGKDFKGWKLPDNNVWWSANKGVLFVQSTAERKGSILWTDGNYKDFIIQADFLLGDGVVDSGIFLRSENDQIQIGISGSLKRDLTASPYIPKKGYPVEAKVKDILKLKDWNTMKVKVVGRQYTVWLNGIEVMNYTSDEKMSLEGPIGLQLHPGNDMSIRYKNIRLAEL
ncbi:MAG: hypothetical protein RLZ10_439 [Bacteroidota bacterium]|jgi:hypothetical protein